MYTSFDETPLSNIIMLLRSQKSEFLSGEKVGNSLGLSRQVVWKNIKKLRTLGYKIRSKPRIGYKLVSGTRLLLPWEILRGLQTEVIGRKIYYFDSIDSTQNFALKLSAKVHENGSVVIAKRQSEGRGRLDRKWISPLGGIWLSILLKPKIEISQASFFPIVAAVALAVSIEKVLNLKPKVKWPNDLTINDKKVSGILIDGSIESNKIDYIIIGVGINFRIKTDKISNLIIDTPRYHGIASLLSKNQKGDPIVLVQQFLFELEQQLYNRIRTNSLAEIRNEWIKRSSTIGKNVTIKTTTGFFRGRATGLDENGALLVSKGKKILRIDAGDIAQGRNRR
jgi:BirA family biotin operon repressor/biotin-[acetyl-CoA-carboxylase] ligase